MDDVRYVLRRSRNISRICILSADYYGFVSKHIRVEHGNYSRGRKHARTHARACATEKLDGEIERTQDSYHAIMPSRTRNTVRNRYNICLARAKIHEEQMRFATMDRRSCILPDATIILRLGPTTGKNLITGFYLMSNDVYVTNNIHIIF